MPLCAVCGSPLADHEQCPSCSPALRAAVSASPAGSLPAAGMPPAGVGTPSQRTALAQALVDGRLAEADTLMAGLVRTLRPLGAEGRSQLAGTLEAWAQLKAAQSLAREADSLLRRAASAAKDPQDLRRKQAAGEDGSAGWDNHAWVRLQADESGRPDGEAVARAQRDLELDLAAKERRWKRVKVGAGVLAGFTLSAGLGLPLAGGSLAGALLGWLWSRHA